MLLLMLAGNAFDPTTLKWQASVFLDWFLNFYYNIVEHHHMMEDELILPWMKSKLGAGAPIVEDSTRFDISAALEQTKQAALNTARLNDADNVDKLRVAAITMVDLVERHLNEVEQLHPQPLTEHFTAAEANEKYQEIFEDRGVYGNKFFLPVIVQSMDKWAGENTTQQFKQKMPLPVRSMLESVWMKHMEIHNWQVIQALRSSKPPANNGVHALLVNHMEIIILVIGIISLAVVLRQVMILVHSTDSRPSAKKQKNKKAD